VYSVVHEGTLTYTVVHRALYDMRGHLCVLLYTYTLLYTGGTCRLLLHMRNQPIVVFCCTHPKMEAFYVYKHMYMTST